MKRGYAKFGNRAQKDGKWQIQRERCRIEDTTKPPPFRDPSAVSCIVPSIMKKFGLENQQWLTKLDEKWTAIVGNAIAKHARPGVVENRRLIVFVDSPVWLNELSRYNKGTMLKNLQNELGSDKISNITFRLDPDE